MIKLHQGDEYDLDGKFRLEPARNVVVIWNYLGDFAAQSIKASFQSLNVCHHVHLQKQSLI
jgi:hypothetical protein